MDINYRYRNIARVILEAAAPLSIGCGRSSIRTDSLCIKDVNGLPYIPGTAIAGVLRHIMEDNCEKPLRIFGDKETGGSELIVTEAKMLGENGEPIDGLERVDFSGDFYSGFRLLPIRQHVRIDNKGVAKKHGKFDEEIVYKGTRFCFEMEVVSQEADNKDFYAILEALHSPELRIGSGSRTGFGAVKIVSLKHREIDLANSDDRQFYISKSSSLSKDWPGEEYSSVCNTENVKKIELSITPVDFILFGAGYGDSDADAVPVKEKIVVWENNRPSFKEALLLPASSLKGALAHRVAYYYNLDNKRYAETAGNEDTERNPAILQLFGGTDPNDNKKLIRGKVVFSDILCIDANKKEKVFNHVAIDRLTGGAMNGALFSEKATYAKDVKFNTELIIESKCDKSYLEYLRRSIADVCEGWLPLGGMTSKGYGFFKGEYKFKENTI